MIWVLGFTIWPSGWYHHSTNKLHFGSKDEKDYSRHLSLKSRTSEFGVHAASLGEFEQGRPLIEKLKIEYPGIEIHLTFFSPSGYEVRKDYDQADHVTYLPREGRRNSRKWLDILDPDMVIFIRYEYWLHYINETSRRNIPIYMVSADFRKDQVFFKWFGGAFRKTLGRFDTIFIRDEASFKQFEKLDLPNGILAGDTRFDRVIQVAEKARCPKSIISWKGDDQILVIGSNWDTDDKVIINDHAVRLLNENGVKMIIAPHHTDADRINKVQVRLAEVGLNPVLYSKLETGNGDVLIIDNIGMLSSLYSIADLVYVGGGFGVAVHNVLEPAVYGTPVIIGPEIGKSAEAMEMVRDGGAKVIRSSADWNDLLMNWTENKDVWKKLGHGNVEFTREHAGAVNMVFDHIKSKINI